MDKGTKRLECEGAGRLERKDTRRSGQERKCSYKWKRHDDLGASEGIRSRSRSPLLPPAPRRHSGLEHHVCHVTITSLVSSQPPQIRAGDMPIVVTLPVVSPPPQARIANRGSGTQGGCQGFLTPRPK